MKISQKKYDKYMGQILADIDRLKLRNSPANSTLFVGIMGIVLLVIFHAPAWAYVLAMVSLITYDKAHFGETAARMTLVKLEALIENFYNPTENE